MCYMMKTLLPNKNNNKNGPIWCRILALSKIQKMLSQNECNVTTAKRAAKKIDTLTILCLCPCA